MSEQELMRLGGRIAVAISRFDKAHDIGIMCEHDERQAGVVVGPNALAGYPFAKGQASHLQRLEAIADALEAAASESETRAQGAA